MDARFLSSPYAILLFSTFIAEVYIAFRLFQRGRWRTIRVVFGFLTTAACLWTLGDFLRLVTPPRYADMWARLRFLGICFVGPLWFLLAYLFVGGLWRRIRRYLPLLFVPSILCFVLLLTNAQHSLFFTKSLTLVKENLAFGPVYWLHFFFSYSFVTAGLVLYGLHYFRNSEKIYRRQTMIMIAGCLVPLLGNMFYIFKVIPDAIDPTPLLFFVSVLLYGVGLVRFSMADLRPIALDVILANIRAGILILDHAGHVVGANPHCYVLFDVKRDVVGLQVEKLLDVVTPKVREPDRLGQWCKEIFSAPGREANLSLDLDIGDRTIDMTYSPILEGQGRALGGVVVLYDMTEWKMLNRSLERDRLEMSNKNTEFLRVNEELRKKNDELERFNRIAVAREMKMIELKSRLKELEGGQ